MPPKQPTPESATPPDQPVHRSRRFFQLERKLSRREIILAAVLAAGLGIWFIFASHAATNPIKSTAPPPHFASDHILLRFRAGADSTVQGKLLTRYGLSVKSEIPQLGVKVVRVNPKALDAVVTALSHNPAVEFAEKDFVASASTTTPNDPLYPAGPTGSGQWPHIAQRDNSAWDVAKGSSSTIVAIVDSGIDTSHPDLAGKTITGYNVLDGSSNTTDTSGHGEAVAGTVSPNSNNGVGVAGVCWYCKLMPVKITDTTTAAYSAMASGITWAVDHGAKVINVSYSGTTQSSALDSAVSYAVSHNIAVVGAAGNSGTSALSYPAASPGAVAVAASDASDNLMNYSNYGSWIQVAAPTSQITTLLINPTGTPYGYGGVGGTSISAPMVAGALALMNSYAPNATLSQLENALFSTTDPLTGKDQAGEVRSIKYGRVNASRALSALGAPVPDTTAPTVSITSPTSNSTIKGQVPVSVSATDNVGVTKVDLYIDGVFYATTSVGPYSFYWDTTKYVGGSHYITAKAYDAAGNTKTTGQLFVTISNPVSDTTTPTIAVTTPASGATLSGTTTVSATGSDNIGVTSSEIYIDGLLRASSTSGSVSLAWDTTAETNGNHTLVSKAYDAAGNVGTSATTTVTVNNQAPITDTIPPTVMISNPAPLSVITSTAKVSATASDNVGVVKMEIFLDGGSKVTSTTGSISTTWNTRKLSSGYHTITVNAYDAAGNISTSTEQVVK